MENENKMRFDKERRKNRKRILVWGSMALVVLLLAMMPLLARQEQEAEGPVASVLSAQAQTGTVTTFLKGGGTLAADGVEDVKLPSGVKITEFLVSNGDTVTEGTPLAAVDKVSVMNAIASVSETLEILQEQIEAAKDDTVSSTVSATAGGRVKVIYAEAGDSVQDVMLEHGALAVLSLDSKMALSIQRKVDLLTGETVAVTLSDGTEVTGRVESNMDGRVVITVEDAGYAIGEPVTVATHDGDRIGAAELYVHNEWKATAFSGTVSAVKVSQEKKVSSGTALFTLTDTEYTGQLQYLSNLHREYEELLQELFQMYESGTIPAPCDGVISGVDKNSPHLLAAREESLQAQLLNGSTGTGWSVVLLSNVTHPTDSCTCSQECPLEAKEQHLEGCIKACDKAVNCDADVHYLSCIHSCDHADSAEGCDATGTHYTDCIKGCVNSKTEGECKSAKHYLTCIESCLSSDGKTDCPATRVHKSSCIEACSHADITGVCEAKKHHYTDCIESCVESESANVPCEASKHKDSCFFCAMVYKAYAAKVDAVGLELVVFWDSSFTQYTVEKTASGWSVAGGTLNEELLVYSDGPTVAAAKPQSFSEGDIILVVTGYKGETAVWSDVVLYKKAAPSAGQSGTPGSGSIGSFSGISGFGGMSSAMSGMMAGAFGGSTAVTQELFDLEGSTLLTVTSQQSMTLTVTIDEQDIAKVFRGDVAQVKVDALKGQTFEAVVTNVGIHGSNNGGSSKFTVELTLGMAEDMLSGMSATATLPLSTKTDVLTIPVAALVEDGAKTVVYTALDKETGEPANPVEVITGLADEETVEILSGLKSGDTVYYHYYDVLELSTEVEPAGISFGR